MKDGIAHHVEGERPRELGAAGAGIVAGMIQIPVRGDANLPEGRGGTGGRAAGAPVFSIRASERVEVGRLDRSGTNPPNAAGDQRLFGRATPGVDLCFDPWSGATLRLLSPATPYLWRLPIARDAAMGVR